MKRERQAPPTFREVISSSLYLAHEAARKEQHARTLDKSHPERRLMISAAVADQRHWRDYAAWFRRRIDANPGLADTPIETGWGETVARRPARPAEPDRRLPPEREDIPDDQIPF